MEEGPDNLRRFFDILLLATAIVLSPVRPAADAADNALSADWSGEWGSWGSGSREQGGNITLYACEEYVSGGRCSFRLRTGKSHSNEYCAFHGSVTFEDGSTAVAVMSSGSWSEPYKPSNVDCSIQLQRAGSEIIATRIGKACDDFCTSGYYFETHYPRRSPKPYIDSPDCYKNQSSAWQAWCTNAFVAQSERKLLLQRIAIEEEERSDERRASFNAAHEQWSKSVVRGCESASNPDDCLVKEYQAYLIKLEKILEDTKQRNAEWLVKFRAPGDVRAAQKLISGIEGVYKRRFANSTIDEHPYTSEDILELVPISDHILYFKLRLEFFNGHLCSLSGPARFSGMGDFNFETVDESPEDTCRLSIHVDPTKIVLVDSEHRCNQFCGARGSIDGAQFERTLRRPIRYMKLLKDSDDYKAAVATVASVVLR